MPSDKLHELEKLSFKVELATPDEVTAVSRVSAMGIVEKVKKKLRRKLSWHLGIFKERGLSFDPRFFELPSTIYLMGNFFSIKYYERVLDSLRSEFQVSSPLSDATKVWLKSIDEAESVCIHIRRGGYANSPSTKDFHGLMSLDYYMRSIEYIQGKVKNAEFFVFSDDLDWAKDNLKGDYPLHLVDANDAENGYQDYHLMLNAHHHIIANSGFSRWPALLNERPGKIVCIPERWFQKSDVSSGDAGPADWIRMAN